MIDYFLTSYNDGTNMHIYYFPGLDDNGHQMTRMSFIKAPNDYRYTKQSDGGIDYIIVEGSGEVVCRVSYVASREYKDITIKL